jgi:hypothetical protein
MYIHLRCLTIIVYIYVHKWMCVYIYVQLYMYCIWHLTCLKPTEDCTLYATPFGTLLCQADFRINFQLRDLYMYIVYIYIWFWLSGINMETHIYIYILYVQGHVHNNVWLCEWIYKYLYIYICVRINTKYQWLFKLNNVKLNFDASKFSQCGNAFAFIEIKH